MEHASYAAWLHQTGLVVVDDHTYVDSNRVARLWNACDQTERLHADMLSRLSEVERERNALRDYVAKRLPEEGLTT